MQQQRQELEEQLRIQHQRNEQLRSISEEYNNQIRELRQTIESQRKSLEDYETQSKQLQEALESLEKHIGSGYFNPRYTKVLHLKQGPPKLNTDIDWRVRNKRAKCREQDSLSFHVVTQPLSSSSSAIDEQSASSAWNALSLPAEKWKEKALDAEKRAQRTRQVAKAKINEFRETCYHLFGWKINVVGAQYR